ncbi:MAG: hypothetical protein GXO75_21065 [Calditrichaeota bacterium]|nr:hypothetical protein [Calditrichota bacterium]
MKRIILIALSLFIATIFIILIACSPKNVKPVVSKDVIVFPSPPDTARIQYLTYFSEEEDIAGKRKGFEKFILGEKKEKSIIIKPYGIAVHNGKIYICDTILGGLEIIDLKNKKFRYFQPRGRGKFLKPINCFVDNDTLYVTDTGRKQIVIFDKNGRYIGDISVPQPSKITDVSVTKDKIWGCDLARHQIHVFDKKTHKLLYSFPEVNLNSPDYLYSPINMCVGNGEVFVSDFGDNRIKIFTVGGEFVRSISEPGRGFGQLNRPKGIAVDRNSHIYIVDASFENVQIFNENGDLLMFFGGHYEGPGGTAE